MGLLPAPNRYNQHISMMRTITLHLLKDGSPVAVPVVHNLGPDSEWAHANVYFTNESGDRVHYLVEENSIDIKKLIEASPLKDDDNV